MTIATTVRDFISGASCAWWNSCRLLILISWVGQSVYGVSVVKCARRTRRVTFYSRFSRRRLVVLGHEVTRHDLFQFGSVIRLIQPGFQERQLRPRIQRRWQVAGEKFPLPAALGARI